MMKALYKTIVMAGMLVAAAVPQTGAERVVILHTNDTHSQIDPDDSDGLGGIVRRKVVIDSVKGVEDNVLLVDAGDFVQGTLYFNLYRGEVEQKLMNELGYDIRILGNHEFDNGIDELADVLADSEAEMIATNYDLSRSPLARKFRPYTIKEYGDKRIGIIGVNLQPKGMISEGNYDGVVYNDAVKCANAAAWWLKHVEKVDAVVAVTHIGYDPSMPPGDRTLAGASEDIDVIIGGHSHDLVSPGATEGKVSRVKNALGRDITVAQVGKGGKYVGEIELDFDDDSLKTDYNIIRIDSRLDKRRDLELDEIIKPYRAGVDSLMRVKVGRSAVELPKGSVPLVNFAADFILERGKALADSIDFAIINKGGLRRAFPKGDITEGMIITMMPFYNYITVLDISGRDLKEAFDVMAGDGGNGVSGNVAVRYDKARSDAYDITIDGKQLDPDRIYRVATIDYLAKGGDYMTSLTRGHKVAQGKKVLYDEMIDAFRNGYLKGKTINPSDKPRMVEVPLDKAN